MTQYTRFVVLSPRLKYYYFNLLLFGVPRDSKYNIYIIIVKTLVKHNLTKVSKCRPQLNKYNEYYVYSAKTFELLLHC